MKASELFLYVINAKPTNITCNRLENNCCIYPSGIYGCCAVKVPFGQYNVQQDVYNSYRARIIKLSSLNRSYCLCDFRRCVDNFCQKQSSIINDSIMKSLPTNQKPFNIEIGFDRTCNLKCPSCRNNYYANQVKQKYLDTIVAYLKHFNLLDEAEHILFASMGEVFYSPYYRKLLTNDYKCNKISILSNGTMFNETNWQLIKNKHAQISVTISVDAVTASTYQKLRGGDFQQLQKNLVMLSQLRQQGLIQCLQLHFVVQQDNYHEMRDFVKYAKELKFDKVCFLHLQNWGTFTHRQYAKKSLTIRNRYLNRELYVILQDLITHEPIVTTQAFESFLIESAKRYDTKTKASKSGIDKI